MKLVIATPLYPPEIGGPATYAKLLEEGLPQKGIEVEVVKFGEVRHLPRLIRHYVYYQRVLEAAKRADVILALDPVSVGLPVMRAAQKAQKPYVVKVVGDYAWEQGQQRFGVTASLDAFVKTRQTSLAVRTLQRIQTRVARSATRVIVPSEYLKGIVVAWGTSARKRISREKIEVIYNAVPLEGLGVVPRPIATLPRPLVVTAGRLVAWKGIDGVIAAVADSPGVSLGIIGDGPLRATLEEQAHAALPGRAVFAGALTHTDMLAVLAAADVFVLNSTYEGLSHLLIEAQSLGVPTIATRVGGNPEVITDGENGLLIPVNDGAALTEAITKLVQDDALRAHLATGARASAQRFSIETMLATTADFFQKV